MVKVNTGFKHLWFESYDGSRHCLSVQKGLSGKVVVPLDIVNSMQACGMCTTLETECPTEGGGASAGKTRCCACDAEEVCVALANRICPV